MCDDKVKLYCLFLKSNIKLFDEFNLYMQRDEPIIYMMQTKCIELLTNLMVKFIKASVFRECKNIFKLNFKDESNQKPDDELSIGQDAKNFMAKIDMSENDRSEFYTSVRNYYGEACSYITNKFPLEEELLMHAEVADIGKREVMSFTSVNFFILKYPCPAKSICINECELEFLCFQVDKLSDSAQKEARMDVKW